jgi:hypothetical protein
MKRDFLSLQIRDISLARSIVILSSIASSIRRYRSIVLSISRHFAHIATGPLQAEAKGHLLCYDDGVGLLFQQKMEGSTRAGRGHLGL